MSRKSQKSRKQEGQFRNKKPVRRLEENQMDQVYLSGIKKYHNDGVSIVIDGAELPEEEWGIILEVREDQSFYMADFVASEETGKLEQIRFDRVYHY